MRSCPAGLSARVRMAVKLCLPHRDEPGHDPGGWPGRHAHRGAGGVASISSRGPDQSGGCVDGGVGVGGPLHLKVKLAAGRGHRASPYERGLTKVPL